MSSLGRALVASWLLVSSALIGTHAASEDQSNLKSIPLRTHSLAPPYLDSDMTSRWFDFGGDTIIRTDQYIRLASDRPSQSGWLFSRAPLSATNWEIELEFSVQGAGTLHGDGFAMWITKDRATPGGVFGHKDEFEGLGIFFDTYKNNRPSQVFPYVMAMMGDGKTKYDQGNDGKANEIGGCAARGLRTSSFHPKAKLTYVQDQSLTLQLSYQAEDEWMDCFRLEASSSMPLKMPKVSYLGFSAETGELSDNFDIISVEAKNMYRSSGGSGGGGAGGGPGSKQESSRYKADAIKNTLKSKSKSSGSSGSGGGGGWGWFLVKTIMFFGVVIGGYVGWTMYRTNRRTRF